MQVAQGGSSQSGDVAGNDVVAGGAVDVNGVKPMAGFQNLFPAVISQAGGGNVVPAQTQLNGTGVIAVAPASVVGQYHLACGFLNMDKYLPLVLMGQGFTIQLELEVTPRLHCANGLSASGQSRIVSMSPAICYYAKCGSTVSCCRDRCDARGRLRVGYSAW